MTTDYERAQDIIQKWIDKNDSDEKLSFVNLNISKLPPLPAKVTRLSISSVPLTSIELPTNLVLLEMHLTNIKELPELPPNLQVIRIIVSLIRELPKLPEKLTLLECDHTSLKTLPTLPNSLIHLYVQNNILLKNLPELPNSLSTLCIANTGITELPEYLPPRLRFLHLEKTKITRLPDVLPESVCWLTSTSGYFMENLPVFINFTEWDHPHEYHKRVKTFEKNIKNIKQELEHYEFPKKRTVKRCKAIKEDLMAATWHPYRVLDWCDPKAFDYED